MKSLLSLALFLLVISSCQKSADFRRIPNGTKVKVDSKVKLTGSIAPFIVDSLYLQSNYNMNFYYCTDAGKRQWIIPDNDLIIIN